MIWVLRILLVGGCTALGFWQGERAKMRYRSLAGLRQALVALRRAVRDAVVLPEALAALEYAPLRESGQRMLLDASLSFEEAFAPPGEWRQEDTAAVVYTIRQTAGMLREERAQVFGDALEGLDEQLEAARTAAQKAAALWQRLGVLGGLAVVLLTL